MEIRKYVLEDEPKVMQMIKNEGEEWKCYWADENQTKYHHALRYSITYIAIDNDEVCGYVRALDDMGFYIYVCDLLVTGKYRGRETGRLLMERLTLDYPDQAVYVMSDVDAYYQKLGYPIIGSILEVLPRL
jgi:ribosomal protein S18 acetylase RimI-like enzyme